ncbi:MAG: NPCBM/NEW2 domain-containing protein, partial [Oscillospiraceae bacterium]|nr:NPCBM/NEW2 domain-containing protein [Oscillospiraceae bacterium]
MKRSYILRRSLAVLLAVVLAGSLWTGGTILGAAAAFTGSEWSTPTIVKVGQLDARALVIPFDDVAGAKANPTLRLGLDHSPNVIGLNGTWKFKLTQQAANRPDLAGVLAVDDTWADIPVPSSWQVAMQYAGVFGDYPIYNNQDYPWQASGVGGSLGLSASGYTMPANNPVGSYFRTFDVPQEEIGRRFILTFNGVESGFYVSVNGVGVGYGEDSFTSKEFDITPYVVAGSNVITAQVIRWTTGSFIENQDMIDYGGIHRDVYITVSEPVSVFDYHVDTNFTDHNYASSEFDLDVDVWNTTNADGDYVVKAYLYDGDQDVLGGASQSVTLAAGQKAKVNIKRTVPNPKLWSAELPNLYTLVMALERADGGLLNTVSTRVGFKEFYVDQRGTSSSNMRINGQNIEFYGVNRGEAHPLGGHYVPYDSIVQDVVNAKQLNINAIRTSHYPADPHLYDLADEYGIYIMDEVNVESHNARTATIPSGDRIDTSLAAGGSRVFPGNAKTFTNAMVDRMEHMVLRDKSHASVLIYSLGNEAGTGPNFDTMVDDVIKVYDPEKLVHYQGENGNSRMDMEGQMYPANYRQSQSVSSKPYIMMEYQHSMGNTGGNLDKYVDVFEASERLQGGFIWDYVDQSAYTLKTTADVADGVTPDELFLGFDGSWQNRSGDGNFCQNGFIYPDRRWKPEAYEVRKQYQDLQFSATESQIGARQVVIQNHNRFRNANYYQINWSLLEDAAPLQSGTFTDADVDIAPRASKTVTVPYSVPEALKEGAEYLLLIEYKLKSDLPYAQAGFVQGSGQFALPFRGLDRLIVIDTLPTVTNTQTDAAVTVTGTTPEGKRFEAVVDKATGLLTAYRADGKDLISAPPVGSFFRAEVDQGPSTAGNAFNGRAAVYDASWYDQGNGMEDVSVTVGDANPHLTKVTVGAKLKNGSTYKLTYTIYGNGSIAVQADLTPLATLSQLGEFGMIMQLPAAYENMAWYGRGPSETYWDRKAGNNVAVYSGAVEDQFFPYMRVQETGNKTDVRWAAFTDDTGAGLLAVGADEVLEVSATHYTPTALSTYRSPNKALYPYQAARSDDVVLRVNWHQKGVGSLDWDDDTTAEFLLQAGRSYSYTYTLQPLFAGQDPMERSKERFAELPPEPNLEMIWLDGVALAGFDPDITNYHVTLRGAVITAPTVTVSNPFNLPLQIEQAESAPGAAKVTVTKGERTVVYTINFLEDSSLFLSALTTPWLYSYSGYHDIYRDANENGMPLETQEIVDGAAIRRIFEHGFAGNSEQIIDFNIAEYEADRFKASAGIDFQMKAGNGTASVIFEVWAHKDVSQLTSSYYASMNPGANGTGTIVTTGWTKLDNSPIQRAGGTATLYNFDVPLTYEENGEIKHYQALRLVMNANGSNGHDQAIWGDPRLEYEYVEPPAPTLQMIRVDGEDLAGFAADVYAYEIALAPGRTEPPAVTAVYPPALPVQIAQAAEIPGAATVTVGTGDGAVVYTVTFTQSSSVYVSDLSWLYSAGGYAPADTTQPTDAIFRDQNGNGEPDLRLRSNASGTAITNTYRKGVAANAFSVVDVDLTALRPDFFKAHAGIDYAVKGAAAGNASGPSVVFKVYAHKDKAAIDYNGAPAYSGRDTTGIGTLSMEGWVELFVSPVQTNDTNHANLTEFSRALADIALDLRYEGAEGVTRHYEAIRLIMDPYNNTGHDNGLWADARFEYAAADPAPLAAKIAEARALLAGTQEGTGAGQYRTEVRAALQTAIDAAQTRYDLGGFTLPTLQSAVARLHAAIRVYQAGKNPLVVLSPRDLEIDERGANAAFAIDKLVDGPVRYTAILALYTPDNRMIGYGAYTTSLAEVHDDAGINYELSEALPAGTQARVLLWDADTRAPFAMPASREAATGADFTHGVLVDPYAAADNPAVQVTADRETDLVTVSGTGFAPDAQLTLLGLFGGETDYANQIASDADGAFTFTYRSNYFLRAGVEIEVSVGGQGQIGAVTAEARYTDDHDGAYLLGFDVVNEEGAPVTDLLTAQTAEIRLEVYHAGQRPAHIIWALYDAAGRL